MINSGQSCIAAKRFIVEAPLLDDFVAAFVQAMRRKRAADPFDPEADLGPLAQAKGREKVHDQVRRSVAAGAACVLGGEIPDALLARLAELGYFGIMLDREHGGLGLGVFEYCLICEELARVDWVIASVVSVSNSLVATSILHHGTEAQKERWLPEIAAGRCLTSACLTEPGGGTDLPNMRTTAVKVDGGTISEARVGLTNMGSTPLRAHAVEEALVGQQATEDAVRQAAASAAEGTHPPSDLNGDADYRRHLATVLTRRAVLAASGG